MILTASAVLVVVLVLLLCREMRLRRALQALLKKLLLYWRRPDAEKPVTRCGEVDDADVGGDRVR